MPCSLSQMWTFSNFRQFDNFSHKVPSGGIRASMFPMQGSCMTSQNVINYNYSSNYQYQITIGSYYYTRRRITSKRKNLNFVKNHGTWQHYCHTKVNMITTHLITYCRNKMISCCVKRPYIHITAFHNSDVGITSELYLLPVLRGVVLTIYCF